MSSLTTPKNPIGYYNGGILIGQNLFPQATESNSVQDCVVIGSDIGSQPAPRNVLLGSGVANKLSSGMTDNCVMGDSALNEADSFVSCVVIGASAARKHRMNSYHHTVGSGCTIIGTDCARNTSSTNVTRTIGANSTLINTGSFSSAGVDPPADSICIGRSTLSKLVSSTTGQICIGNEGVHNTAIINTDQSIILRTDSLNNVETTATSTIIRNLGTTDTHSISLLCGAAARLTFTRIAFRLEGTPMAHDGYCTDFSGKSIRGVGNSYWVSGASNIAIPTEKRRLVVLPNQVVAADDSTTRQMAAYDEEGSNDTLMPSERAAAVAQMLGGMRVATAAEMYVFFQRPPDGWKCVGARLELLNKSTSSSSSKQIEIFSRSFLTTIDSDPTNSDYLTIHVNQSLDRRTCSDVIFTTAWTPGPTDYLVGHIGAGSSNSVFIGGYLEIERI